MTVQQHPADPSLARHFAVLVYPFRHAVAGKEQNSRLTAIEGIWRPWWGRLDDGALQRALDDTYFFLPHIRELLFPETAHLPVGDPKEQVEEARRLAALEAAALAGRLAPQLAADAVLRLAYDPARLENLHLGRLELERRNEQGEVVEQFHAPVRLHWVDVALFPQQVGLLALKVELAEEQPSVRRLNRFLHYLQIVHPLKVGWELATWRTMGQGEADTANACIDTPTLTKGGMQSVTRGMQSRDLVDFLLQGLVGTSDRVEPSPEQFLHQLERPGTVRYTATDFGQVYGTSFHRYTYACLAGDPAPRDGGPASKTEGPAADALGSPLRRMVYELATCTETSDPDYAPDPAHVAELLRERSLAFWENWQGLALHDSVVFLGTGESRFTLGTLAHNVESDYFNLYLFTLFQKTRLSMLSGDLVRREANLQQNLRETRRLLDGFTMFQNHYWFSEVTRRPQGTELYHRFQRGLDVLPLYQQVHDQVHELQQYYEAWSERRVNSLLAVLAIVTAVALPAGLAVELYSNALIQQATWPEFWVAVLGLYTALLTLLGAWRLWVYFSGE